METFLGTRRKQELVFPSGVKFGMLSLLGEHQRLITEQDEKKRRSAIDDMLLSCISYIGNKEKVTKEDIENLLSMDRAYALFELRKFSNKRSPNFVFDYEFPVDKTGNRRKQRYEVIFDKKDFPTRPYSWVLDVMAKEYIEKNGITSDTLEDEVVEDLCKNVELFPVIYDSYQEMLSIHKYQKTKLEDSNVEVSWQLLDGKYEKVYSINNSSKRATSHTQLLLRKPTYNDGTFKEEQKLPDLPLDRLSYDDIEQLREEILKREANIETSVVIQYKEDASSIVQLNLISVPAFFFPSLAK